MKSLILTCVSGALVFAGVTVGGVRRDASTCSTAPLCAEVTGCRYVAQTANH